MSRCARHLIAALAAGALLVAGCGSDKPKGKSLPQATATELVRRLDEIQRRYRTATVEGKIGACNDIQRDSFLAIGQLIASLPKDVDADLRSAVDDSFQRLRELTQQGCADVQTPTNTETNTTPETVTEQQTVTNEQTAPEPTDTQPPPTTPKQPKQPKDNGKGNGNGNGGTKPGQGAGGVPSPLPGEG